MKVFILAGGLGVRLRPLTDNLPKVMIKVGGKPVLEHLINLCRHHGLTEIILSTHYMQDKIKSYFKDGKKFKVHLDYSHEKEMLGSAGAIKLAAAYLKNDNFFVLNGDVMTNVDLTKMIEFHYQRQALGTVLIHKTDHPYDSDLVEVDKNNRLIRFFRPCLKDKTNFKPLAKTGTHIFNQQILNFIPSGCFYSLEKDLIPELIKQDQSLYAFYSNCYSKDMGTLERLKQVRQDYERNKISF